MKDFKKISPECDLAVLNTVNAPKARLSIRTYLFETSIVFGSHNPQVIHTKYSGESRSRACPYTTTKMISDVKSVILLTFIGSYSTTVVSSSDAPCICWST